jgi:hypothetical protein
MAGSAVRSVSSQILSKSKGNRNESVCKKCSEYKTQVKEVLDELGSARSSNFYKRSYIYDSKECVRQ